MNLESLKKLLRNNNLKPNFTYGQNFLLDEIVLQDMVDASEVKRGVNVLEIGPGIGNLTRKLLETGANVLSVEKDPNFFSILKSIKKDFKNNFWFEIADVLECDYEKCFADHLALSTKHSYSVVANIPYFITGKILRMLFFKKHKPQSITILTQKEVAQNIIAGPGKLSLLAISVQIFGKPEIIAQVPARSFYPVPKVDSAVLQIEVFKKPKIDFEKEKQFFGILRACFAGKRKQLHNTLKNNLQLKKEDIEKFLGEAGVSSTARPQELTIEQWIKLSESIKN
jgi:16S rRNA (adenine1518-N6/adenine1519-N6)-dimethyltransferase